MTRNEFMKALSSKRDELIEKRNSFEQELIEALAPVIDNASLDQDGNLVLRTLMIQTPLLGLNSDEIKSQLSTLPWVVYADWGKKFLDITVRELPETYCSAIKPVIGFHS